MSDIIQTVRALVEAANSEHHRDINGMHLISCQTCDSIREYHANAPAWLLSLCDRVETAEKALHEIADCDFGVNPDGGWQYLMRNTARLALRYEFTADGVIPR